MDGVSKAAMDKPQAALPAWRAVVPWWAKIAAKIVLSRLPMSGAAWQKLGLFSPGFMLDADYAIGVFHHHYEQAGSPESGFTFLELGPGDSLATAAIAWAHGAAGGWLVDAGAYASRDIAVYRSLFARLVARRTELNLRRDPRELDGCQSVDALLALTSTIYREDGLQGLRSVPAGSVDLVLSQATLEHVPRGEFAASMAELYRVMKPGAVATHQIDFRDHLGGSLHNLRFADATWEQPWFARRSGFYTNRLRLSEIVAAMTAAKLSVETVSRDQWQTPPVARRRLAKQFHGLTDDDLRTSSAVLLARKHG